MSTRTRRTNREPDLTCTQIEELIKRDDISVISFDLFDTLLARPSVYPRDIFSLLQNQVKNTFNLDFLKIRLSAEEELQDDYATFDQIYDHIAKRHHLKPSAVSALKNMELKL